MNKEKKSGESGRCHAAYQNIKTTCSNTLFSSEKAPGEHTGQIPLVSLAGIYMHKKTPTFFFPSL